jgi:hypothetical protein
MQSWLMCICSWWIEVPWPQIASQHAHQCCCTLIVGSLCRACGLGNAARQQDVWPLAFWNAKTT